MADELRDVFLDALEPSLRDQVAEVPDLEATIGAKLEAAREQFPELDIPGDQYAAYTGARLTVDGEPSVALESLRWSDLFLACACAQGDPRAISQFDRQYGNDIDLGIARSGNVRLSKDEFRQLVRDKLFVAKPAVREAANAKPPRPKIADYAGRGDLRSWVRVITVRMIVDIVRQKGGVDKEILAEPDMLVGVAAPAEDPELEYIQRVYKNEFREALQDGFASLTSRERNLLRHQVLHGLNIDQVGAIYRVHRTTAFRWIEKARKQLLRNTREALMKRLQIGQSEFRSIMRVVQSRLELSVRRMLDSNIEDEPSGS